MVLLRHEAGSSFTFTASFSVTINDTLVQTKEEADLFTKDIIKTIQFLDSECSDEECYWMSEVFDDLIEITANEELYLAMEARGQKVTNKFYKHSISVGLNYTQSWLNNSCNTLDERSRCRWLD